MTPLASAPSLISDGPAARPDAERSPAPLEALDSSNPRTGGALLPQPAACRAYTVRVTTWRAGTQQVRSRPYLAFWCKAGTDSGRAVGQALVRLGPLLGLAHSDAAGVHSISAASELVDPFEDDRSAPLPAEPWSGFASARTTTTTTLTSSLVRWRCACATSSPAAAAAELPASA